jgi:hypothetical protein
VPGKQLKALELRRTGLTLQQVGDELGISREYARQLVKGTDLEFAQIEADRLDKRKDDLWLRGWTLIDTYLDAKQNRYMVKIKCQNGHIKCVSKYLEKITECLKCSWVGRVHGEYTVIGEASNRGKFSYVKVRCSCGNIREIAKHRFYQKTNIGTKCRDCGLKDREANRKAKKGIK